MQRKIQSNKDTFEKSIIPIRINLILKNKLTPTISRDLFNKYRGNQRFYV